MRRNNIAKYYMVSQKLPRSWSTYFKAKSKAQIMRYCKANGIGITYIFPPRDSPEKGTKFLQAPKYQDISKQ